LVVQQLQNQRASVSGVSLDEEAANLVQFQNAYDAAARVFSVVDQLTQTAMSLGVS
jgi:flagellar hook-associated protein 1 FlgK